MLPSSVFAPALLSVLLWHGPEPVTSRMDVEYEAPSECPGKTETLAAAETYLGREEFDPRVAEVKTRVVIQRQAGPEGWRLKLEMEGAGITLRRDLTGRECGDLADAAGLMIAVALDPLRVTQVATSKPKPEPAPRPKPGPSPGPSPDPRVWGEARVGAGVSLALLPKVSATVVAAVSLAGRLWRVDLVGLYAAPRRTFPFETAPGVGARVQLGAAGLRACVVPTVKTVTFPSCAGVLGGAMRGRGLGIPAPETSYRPWIAVSVGQELVWVSRAQVGLWLGIDGMVVVLQPLFEVGGAGDAFDAAAIAGQIAGGPVLRF